tara:strand:+ start:6434 stop:6808 length:375 start_codon:yes stop_codon:yes gene_type:complete
MKKEINVNGGEFFLHKGKMLRFKGTKRLSDRMNYSFEDWRFAGGMVLSIFHSEEDEKKAFDKIVDWGQKKMLDNNRRLDKKKEILNIMSNPITCPAIIDGWEKAKEEQDQEVYKFYERNPQIND